MNNQLITASITGLIVAGGVYSTAFAGEPSANIAIASDYSFRGISQTDRDLALQGGLDYAWDSGFYIGTWASNVDNFSPSPVDGSNGAQLEVDFYGGYGFDLTDNVSLDGQVLYYYYPGASTAANQPEIDYVEFIPAVSYSDDNLSASFSVAYSPEFFAEAGDAFYYNTDFSFPLVDALPFGASDLALGAHFGYQTIDDNAAFGTPDYTDWSVSLSTSFVGFDWSVAYVDTDLSRRECFAGSDLCDSRAVATISRSF